MSTSREALARIACSEISFELGVAAECPAGDCGDAPIEAPPSADVASAAGGPPSVLVTEDNPSTQALVRHLLRADYDATYASHAREALAIAEGTSFDVLLLDINLGDGCDGKELLCRLRASAESHGPAIAFTAHAKPGDAEQFLADGFDGYLGKPFTKKELLGALEEALLADDA